MPGDDWQQFANLRLLYCYQWFYPGKQLLFMGGEFAQEGEWNASESLPWARVDEPLAQGTGRLIAALNELQANHPALAQWDCDRRGFEWLSGEDSENSVISFLRHAQNETLALVFNFTPEPRTAYRIPIHKPGKYHVVFNSDATEFGGTGGLEKLLFDSKRTPRGGHGNSLAVDLPPLAAIVLARET